jgi:two-component system sensor histidine kinase UhpB
MPKRARVPADRADRQRRHAEDQLRRSQTELRRLTARMEHARESERALIARELHDELGQSLTATKLDVARLARTMTESGPPPAAIDTLQSMVGSLDVAIETVRRLATALRPPALDDIGLVGAIELEAAAHARRTGLRCRVEDNEVLPPLHPTQTTALFRIVQEALNNIVRHANASAVGITIEGRANALSIRVKDNGRGMDRSMASSHSALGLLGMRERADMIGARLAIRSARGKGTSVSIALTTRPRRRKSPA